MKGRYLLNVPAKREKIMRFWISSYQGARQFTMCFSNNARDAVSPRPLFRLFSLKTNVATLSTAEAARDEILTSNEAIPSDSEESSARNL